MIDKWDKRFLELAEHVATWSKDRSTQVGAVIVDDQHRVVGVGFNGFPRGVTDDFRLDDREVKYGIVVHGELNAILNAAFTEGCTMYTSLGPCSQCAAAIIQAGIARVVSPDTTHPRFMDSIRLGREILEEAGVVVELAQPSRNQQTKVITFALQEMFPEHAVNTFEIPNWMGTIYRLNKPNTDEMVLVRYAYNAEFASTALEAAHIIAECFDEALEKQNNLVDITRDEISFSNLEEGESL